MTSNLLLGRRAIEAARVAARPSQTTEVCGHDRHGQMFCSGTNAAASASREHRRASAAQPRAALMFASTWPAFSGVVLPVPRQIVHGPNGQRFDDTPRQFGHL